MKFLGRVVGLFVAGVTVATPSEEKPRRRLGSPGEDASTFLRDARAKETANHGPPSILKDVTSGYKTDDLPNLRVRGATSGTSLKYNQVRMKSTHNSYMRSESYSDQLYYYRIRSLEIDVHPDSEAQSWQVYHMRWDKGRTRVTNLRDVIKIFSEFHEQVPNHEVVTVWVDNKGGFTSTHAAGGFDSIIEQLPLYTPNEAAGGSDSIRDGIVANGWPEMQALRGKFIFVVTSGQRSYCSSDDSCRQRKAFSSAKSASSLSQIGTRPWIVFYNQNTNAGIGMGRLIHDAGFVSRVYDNFDINTPQEWNRASQNMFNHIATDRVNSHRDTFARTTNALGYPFESLVGGIDVSRSAEDIRSLYFHSETGDTWGTHDEMAFAYHENSDGDVIYTATIATPGSHIDPGPAKSGIMVRESVSSGDWNGDGSPYFAVVRPTNSKLRVQYRSNAGEDTLQVEAPDYGGDGLKREEDRLHVRLVYKRSPDGVTVNGYFKPSDSEEYILIGGHRFGGNELKYQGLFGSSNGNRGFADGTKVGSTFVNFAKNGNAMKSDQFSVVMVGDATCAPAYFGDGFAPRAMPTECPLLPRGSPCDKDEECASGNCRWFRGTCS